MLTSLKSPYRYWSISKELRHGGIILGIMMRVEGQVPT